VPPLASQFRSEDRKQNVLTASERSDPGGERATNQSKFDPGKRDHRELTP
jgi:hypothetical protein